MREPIFCGACTAIVTPFTPEGKINYPVLAQLLDEQLQGGIDAICVCGTTGESATMTPEEHRAVIEYVVQHVKHQVKIIAGSGSNNTATAIELSLHAQEAGADALLLVTPYYNKATQQGLIHHYELIAQKTDLPMILYNVPSRTGVSFTAETYQILSQNPKINGVKEASGNFSLITRTRQLCGDDFYIWSGNDDQVVPLMALGAKGVISVASNLLPNAMTEMTHRCLTGDFSGAARLQIELIDFIEALFIEVNPIPVKTALKMLGKDVGPLRTPLCDLSPQHIDTLQKQLIAVGLLKQN